MYMGVCLLKKTLKYKNLGNIIYNYLEFEDSLNFKFSTDFFVTIPYTEEFIHTVNDFKFNPFLREFLELPIVSSTGPDTLSIFTMNSENMSHLTIVAFEEYGIVHDYRVIDDAVFQYLIQKMIIQKQIFPGKFEVESTIEKLHEEKYRSFLPMHYSPTNVDDTGIKINNVQISYNNTYSIPITEFELVTLFTETIYKNVVIKDVYSIQITTHDTDGAYATLGTYRFLDKNGSPLPFHKYSTNDYCDYNAPEPATRHFLMRLAKVVERTLALTI